MKVKLGERSVNIYLHHFWSYLDPVGQDIHNPENSHYLFFDDFDGIGCYKINGTTRLRINLDPSNPLEIFEAEGVISVHDKFSREGGRRAAGKRWIRMFGHKLNKEEKKDLWRFLLPKEKV